MVVCDIEEISDLLDFPCVHLLNHRWLVYSLSDVADVILLCF